MIRTYKWTTKNGKRRIVRLARAWKNLQNRVAGRVTGVPYWTGLPVEFVDFDHFRTWSLASGYSGTLCSLDRIDSTEGYSPSNCRWVTKAENCRRAVIVREKRRQ